MMRTGRGAPFGLAVVALAAVCALAPVPPALVERWFSTGVYPAIQRAVTPVSNLVPFAVFDVLGLALVAGLATVIVRAARAARRERRAWPLLRAAGRLGVAVAVGYVVFLGLWGLNYRRVPMRERLLVERATPAPGAVLQLGLDSAARLNALHADAHRAGWPADEWRHEPLRAAFHAVQRILSEAPVAEPGRLKRTLLGPYFRWASIDGMVDPFALEVLANPDLLPFERPFVAAHEWAHLAGYADEAEASFVGWLTCIRADRPTQYSGWLSVFWQVRGEIGQAERARLDAVLEAGPRADVAAVVDRLRRAQVPWLRTAGWAVYDQYLKANRVDGGVRSYGDVVTMILGVRFEDGWTPVLRGAADTIRRGGS